MRTGNHCVRGFIPPVHHCAMRLSLCRSPLCHAIVCRLPPCHGIVPPVHYCFTGLSMWFTTVSGDLFLRFTIVSWECLRFTTVPCECLSVIQQCHGIVAPVQQYVHGMILRVHHCVMGFINPLHHYVRVLSFCGLPLCHGIVPLVHNCDSAHLVRLQVMGPTPWFTAMSWDCLSGSLPCHAGLSLWCAMSRVCSSGTPLCHGIAP